MPILLNIFLKDYLKFLSLKRDIFINENEQHEYLKNNNNITILSFFIII